MCDPHTSYMNLYIFQIHENTFCCLFRLFRWLCANHCVIVTVFLTWMTANSFHNKSMRLQTPFLSHRNISGSFLTSFQISISLSIPLASFPPHRFPLNLERGQSRYRGRKRHKNSIRSAVSLAYRPAKMFISPRWEIGTISWLCRFVLNLILDWHVASFGYISGVFTLWPK